MKKLISLLISAVLLISGCSGDGADLSDSKTDTTTEDTQKTTDVTEDKVEVPKDIDVVQIACGSNYQLFLSSDGDVYAQGKNSEGALGVGDFKGRLGLVRVNIPEPVKMIDDCVAVTENNDIYIWSTQYIEDEKIIEQNPQPEGYTSLPFTYISTPQKIEFGKSVKKIYNNWLYTNILTEDGEVYTFGAAENDDMGNIIKFAGDYYPTPTPYFVKFPEKIVDLSSGYKHSLALGESGTLYGYGILESDQLGQGLESTDSYIVVANKFVVAVFAACDFGSFFVDKNEPTVLYGTGHLIGVDMYAQGKDFVRFELPSEIVEVFTSFDSSIVIKCKDGNLYGLGYFYQGFYNLGRGTQQPTLVESDIEISEVVRYAETIYVKDVKGDFYRYDMPTKSSVEVKINEDDIGE